ncbi:MAG: hypothetical protein IT308_08875 [Anaerolineaceae bacterium]|nr:hypothetical protein [Anaerolineaceae bacterium]
MLLNQLLDEITNARAPLSVNELSRKLHVEPAMIEEMINFWVRKGRLVDDSEENMSTESDSHCGSCSACPESKEGAHAASASRTYSIPSRKR